MARPLTLSIATGLAIGGLAWIDPLFIPLVLAGPIITGAIAGARNIAFRWVALAWTVSGISMLTSDWILNNEDRIFHTGLTIVMVGLASLGWLAASRLGRRKSASRHVLPGN